MDARGILTRLYRAAVAAVDPAALVGEALGRRGAGVFVRSLSARAQREFVFAPSRVAVLAVVSAASSLLTVVVVVGVGIEGMTGASVIATAALAVPRSAEPFESLADTVAVLVVWPSI